MPTNDLSELLWQIYRHTSLGKLDWRGSETSPELRAEFSRHAVGIAPLKDEADDFVLRLYHGDEVLEEARGADFPDRMGGLSGTEKMRDIYALAAHSEPDVRAAVRSIIDELYERDEAARRSSTELSAAQ